MVLTRFFSAAGCCLGLLSFRERVVAFTLERGEESATKNKSYRIPAGLYTVGCAPTTTCVSHSWCSKRDRSLVKFAPLIFSEEVPKDRSIRIHIGNRPEHTAGCVLVGLSISALPTNKELIRLDEFLNLSPELAASQIEEKLEMFVYSQDPSSPLCDFSLQRSTAAMERLYTHIFPKEEVNPMDPFATLDRHSWSLEVKWMDSSTY